MQQREQAGALLLLTCGTYGKVIRFPLPLTIKEIVVEERLATLARAMQG